jgi:hypothetical protein
MKKSVGPNEWMLFWVCFSVTILSGIVLSIFVVIEEVSPI